MAAVAGGPVAVGLGRGGWCTGHQQVSGFCYLHELQRPRAPHFHARRQDEEVTIGITTGLVTGRMSAASLRRVLDRVERHQAELSENWILARNRGPLNPISPD